MPYTPYWVSNDPQPALLPPIQPPSSLSFTQGFLLGQLSIALIIFFFIKFFIFGDPPSADDRALHLSSLRRARTLAHQHTTRKRSNSNSTSLLRHKDSRSIIRKGEESRGGPSIATILAKTYYNVKGHQPESLDWFNVLIAQTIAQLRADARQDNAVLTSLTDILNGGVKPDWIGDIHVTEIALGDEFPIFSNCRVMPAEDSGVGGVDETRLQAKMDVDLSDVITIGIETTLNLNWPKPMSAVLPVALAVSIVRFSGTLALSFIPSSSPDAQKHQDAEHADAKPPPSTPTPKSPKTPAPAPPQEHPHRPTTLSFTFLHDYRLDLSVRSLVGSRSRLQDVPKIAQLIESRVHAWFDERAVEPRFQQIVLPSLWPRKHNTRGGEEDVIIDDEEDGDGVMALGEVMTAEQKLEDEGRKIRDAEVRAGERKKGATSSGSMPVMREEDGSGVRRRPQPASRFSSFSQGMTGLRGMPGAMPW
ncbi:hypothetical protein P153DRAFT_386793 [Dothidotthia symphoricarpi CBS 119687]|uniref:Maintenance of mitochondrial morphology protein 1 n=1 Tax=Dothidotthia symphoricarpi CBS 119687 TaxID=1392245 RepID=A0A6A6ACS4_9PLEO|nr:uncharacterized protein P153DRAFT_386793 [Dothidotthia symphoricarpi CBS 119687]KAF2128677.1 hypothetical protein P153DRAFT_386793 [Dothidotthia symphoricarpi CBS 119687]